MESIDKFSGYFTPKPKRSKEDFYNIEDELLTLKKGLKHVKLVVCF